MADTWTAISGYTPQNYTDTAVFEVNSDTKKIALITGQPLVAGEENAQYMRFSLDRYWDGIDIKDKAFYVEYALAGTYYGKTSAVNAEYNTEQIRFGWVVPKEACCISGALLFVLRIESEDYVLKTQIAEHPVFKSVNVEGVVPEPTKEAWYREFEARVESAISEAENAISAAQAVQMAAEIAAQNAQTAEDNAEAAAAVAQTRYGSPLVAHTAEEMAEQNRVYVYTGSETGYTAGNWYYYDGSAWVSGGVYNSSGINTDTTLTQSGMAADAKATGDEISELKSGISAVDLVDRTAILFGYLNATGGEVYPNPAGANHEIMTDFIPVTAGKDYTMFWWGTLGGGYWHRLCWYDSEKNYISNSTYSLSQTTSGWFMKITDYTAPSNAAYVRVSVRSYDDGVFSFYTGRINHAEKPNWYDFVNAPHVTDSANVKSINHAGYSGTDGAPENTIPAFVQSKAHGFDFIECDTAVTKDGVVVCIHDNTIDRTSDGTGNVRDLTYEQLQQYDFGSWKSEEYAGTKIPKLEEVLDVCKALRLHPYVEIKYNGSFTRAEVEQIVDLVRSKGMLDSVTFISFSPQQLGWVMSAYKYARLGLITNTAGDSTINFTDWAQIRRILQILRNGVNSVFANVRKETIDPTHTSYIEGINKVYSYDLPVECWTVYDTRFWFGRVDKCVNGFTTVTYKYDDWAEEQYGLGGN